VVVFTVGPAWGQASAKGLIFRASFDRGVDADTAVGSVKALPQGEVVLTKGIKGQGVLVNGGPKCELKYESAGNLNGKEGTISLWACSKGFTLDDEFFHVFFDSYDSPMKNGDALILYKHFKTYNTVQLLIRPRGENSQAYSSAKRDFRWRPGEWHHLAAVWGNGSLCFYVDGDKMTERAYPGEFTGFGKFFYIGASHNRWSFRPPAPDTIVDEVRIYNRKLSDEEIRAGFREFNLSEINKVAAAPPQEASVYEEPMVDVVATPAPPVIDGTVNQEEWRHATGISGMISLNLGTMTTRQAQFFFLSTKTISTWPS